MTTQPEALRLAGALTAATEQTDAEDDVIHVARWFVEDAAAELRRLRAQRDALLETLRFIADHDLRGADLIVAGHIAHSFIGKARAAIKAVEGEQEAHWQAVAQEAQKHFDEGLKKFEGEKE